MKSFLFSGTCVLLLTCAPLSWAQTGGAPAAAPSPAPASPSSGGKADQLRRANADAPSSLFLQGFLVIKEAEQKEKAGDFAGAYFKLRDARDLFDSTYRADSSWQPDAVERRRRSVRDDMERVRQLEIKRRASGGEVSLSGVVGAGPDPNDMMVKGNPPPGNAARNTNEVVDERLRGLSQQIENLTKRNEEILQRLGAREQELRNANRDLLASRQTENELRNDLEDAKTKIQTAGASERRRNETLTKTVKELEGKLQQAVEKLSAANDSKGSLLADLEKAYGEIRQRTTERDELQRERDELAAMVASSDGGKGVEKLKVLDDNKRLRKQLESAQADVARLTSEKTRDAAQIKALQEQVQSVQTELVKFQQENLDYRQQISALTSRLDETSARLGEVAEGSIPEVEAGLENKILRSLILQQLKRQTLREAAQRNVIEELAREGVLDKMRDMGVETERLMRSLHEMAAAVPLSKEQRGVLSNSKLEGYLLQNGVGDLMMTQDVEELRNGTASTTGDGSTPPPAVDEANAGNGEPAMAGNSGPTVRDKAELSPELKAYANAAEEQFSRGDFTSAENQYGKILVVDPINVYGLVNMGVTQMRQGKNLEAKANIEKALAFDYDRGSTHYLLGMLHMRMGSQDKAVEEIQEGLKLDPKNANAHLALGVIAFQNKQRDTAERELLQAIEIDPSCAMAHFNLAVLYGGDEKKFARGAEHYRQAIRNGYEHDPKMDSYYGS